METVELLVSAARGFAKQGSVDEAVGRFEGAIELDPSRLDLHVETAEVEAMGGRIEDASQRLERLVNIYLDNEMADEAADVIALLESLGAVAEPGAIVDPQTGATEPMTVVMGAPELVERGHTEFCSQPVLLYPDGSPLPGQTPRWAPKPVTEAAGLGGRRPVMRTGPVAPALRRPARALSIKPIEDKKPTTAATPKGQRSRTDILPPRGTC